MENESIRTETAYNIERVLFDYYHTFDFYTHRLFDILNYTKVTCAHTVIISLHYSNMI